MSSIRNRRQILTIALAVAMSIAPSMAAKNKKSKVAPAPPPTGFPASALSLIPGSDRLTDEAYARLVSGDALLQVDPKILYQRMTTASFNGENYKALYFARIITARVPDNAAAWSNRSQLAASLGLNAEAQAAKQNADNPAGRVAVPGEVLPGLGRLVAPATLADWAGAMSLMADDLGAVNGAPSVVAVRDNTFGVEVVTGESGPETVDRPLLLDGILLNAFTLTQAEPMNPKRVNAGFLIAGIFAGLGGMTGSYLGDANMAARGSELYGQSMAHAVEVDSTLEGGTYKAQTFPGGKPTLATRSPKPSGKFSAVEWPVPVLFASGRSTSPTVEAHWAKKGKSATRKITRKGGEAKVGNFKSMDLSFVRLATLRDSSDQLLSPPVTAFELMLSSDDMEVLGGAAIAALRPNLTAAERSFLQTGQLVLDPSNAGKGLVGIAQDGSAYAVEIAPCSWIVAREAL